MTSRDAATAQAMIVVDVQRGWVSGAYAVTGADDLLHRLSTGLDAARAAGAMVVHLQDVGDADSSVPPGTPGRELALTTLGDEPVIPKTVDDGFAQTDLEQRLRAAGVQTVVVGGLQSEMCVAATVRGALARRFGVVLPRDAHATHDIPPDGGQARVPAGQVRRVAEWSLGDEIVVVDGIADVVFERPHRCRPTDLPAPATTFMGASGTSRALRQGADRSHGWRLLPCACSGVSRLGPEGPRTSTDDWGH